MLLSVWISVVMVRVRCFRAVVLIIIFVIGCHGNRCLRRSVSLRVKPNSSISLSAVAVSHSEIMKLLMTHVVQLEICALRVQSMPYMLMIRFRM